jgi:hypothetical protein
MKLLKPTNTIEQLLSGKRPAMPPTYTRPNPPA